MDYMLKSMLVLGIRKYRETFGLYLFRVRRDKIWTDFVSKLKSNESVQSKRDHHKLRPATYYNCFYSPIQCNLGFRKPKTKLRATIGI